MVASASHQERRYAAGLYIDEGISIEDVASRMSDDYIFDAK